MESVEDVEVINRLLQPFIPTLEARKLKRALPLESEPSCSKQMKSEPQQRLFSTKVPKKKSLSISKPSVSEQEAIAASLLLH